MSHIVNSCPLTKFDGGLLRLHEVDEAAVDWLTWLLAHDNNNNNRAIITFYVNVSLSWCVFCLLVVLVKLSLLAK